MRPRLDFGYSIGPVAYSFPADHYGIPWVSPTRCHPGWRRQVCPLWHEGPVWVHNSSYGEIILRADGANFIALAAIRCNIQIGERILYQQFALERLQSPGSCLVPRLDRINIAGVHLEIVFHIHLFSYRRT
jgi:hypothetical protein